LRRAYLEGVAFPRPAGPRALLADLRGFFGSRSKPQLVAGSLAVVLPALIIWGFVIDSEPAPPPPRIIYAENWRADRTDEEIVALQKVDQAKREALQRERQRQLKELQKRMPF